MSQSKTRVVCSATVLAGLLFGGLVSGKDIRFDVLPWLHAETEHFDVFSTVPESQTRAVATEFERFRLFIDRVFPELARDDREKTRVLAFNSLEQFGPYTRRSRAGVPQTMLGYYFPSPIGDYIALHAAEGSDFRRVVCHEYMHEFLERRFAHLPPWFEEGFADYFGSVEFGTDGARTGAPIDGYVEDLKRSGRMPLRRLFEVSRGSPEYDESDRSRPFYATSWLLVHYLLNVAGPRRLTPTGLLALSTSDQALHVAVLEHLGTDIDALQGYLDGYLERLMLDRHAHRVAVPSVPDLTVRRASVADAGTRLAELLAFAVEDAAAASQHLQVVGRLEPDRPDARRIRAYLAHQADDPQGEQLRREMARHPDDATLPLLFGLNLIQRVERDSPGIQKKGAPVPPLALQAREMFRKSLELDPQSGEALHGLGWTYLPGTQDPTAGIAAEERAREVLGGRFDVLSTLALLYSRAGRGEDARRVMEELQRKTTDPTLLREVSENLALERQIEAVDLFGQGRHDDAIEIMTWVVQTIETPAIRTAMEATLADMRQKARHNSCAVRYNEAADLLNARRTRAAMDILEALQAECMETPVADHIRRATRMARSRLGSR